MESIGTSDKLGSGAVGAAGRVATGPEAVLGAESGDDADSDISELP